MNILAEELLNGIPTPPLSVEQFRERYARIASSEKDSPEFVSRDRHSTYLEYEAVDEDLCVWKKSKSHKELGFKAHKIQSPSRSGFFRRSG